MNLNVFKYIVREPYYSWGCYKYAQLKKPQLVALFYYQWHYIKKHGLNVYSGPFGGMRYINQAVGSSLFHKLVGIYESSLHKTFTILSSHSFDSIIDIGSAEGYYLIGMGMHQHTNTRLIAFDTDSRALTLVKKLYQTNGLSQELILHNHSTSTIIDREIQGETLIISDCEGYEHTLLNPRNTAKITQAAALVVELHPHLANGVEQDLMEWFTPTHYIHKIGVQEDIGCLQKLYPSITHEEISSILFQERQNFPQEWFIMIRRDNKSLNKNHFNSNQNR